MTHQAVTLTTEQEAVEQGTMLIEKGIVAPSIRLTQGADVVIM